MSGEPKSRLERIRQLQEQIKGLQAELEQLMIQEDIPVIPVDVRVPEMPLTAGVGQDKMTVKWETIQAGQYEYLDRTSSEEDKINLFRSLFRGREDVCAKKWRNKSGYSPYCNNDFRPGVCQKPRTHCSDCPSSDFAPLGPEQVREHLTGREVLGLYPLTREDTCWLLAMDLDEGDWQGDARIIREISLEHGFPVSLERSRSGQGGHLWWFFDEPVKASLARSFGMTLLELAMTRSSGITFASFDRFFPSQDMLPKDGFGNLIALPLQKEARASGNTLFLDEEFQVIPDQWAHLSRIRKIQREAMERFCRELGSPAEAKEPVLPGLSKIKTLGPEDFPDPITITRGSGLIIAKQGLSTRAIHALRHLASYGNPEFFAKQAMRLSTYGTPRMTVAYEEDAQTIRLPRGTESKLLTLLDEAGAKVTLVDQRVRGRDLNIAFKGKLTDHQEEAFQELIAHDNGVLEATTGFGKTVIGARIIAEKRCPTLILVHTKELAGQWKSRLEEFLTTDEVVEAKRRPASVIGQLGGGRKNPHGIVDIALIQSLVDREHEVKAMIHDYGMVIVDECHHISAVNFSRVISEVDAAWVYGLTATPIRKDGHHPIIFLHCGPIRYQVSAKSEAVKRAFTHTIIPRFTGLRLPPTKPWDQWHITEIYERIADNEVRNDLIIRDVVRAVEAGRTPLILTQRTEQLKYLEAKMSQAGLNVISLYGTMKARERKDALTRLKAFGPDESFVLLATGRLIGEGFDEPRLDTLFLAMPIAWKGTVAQYAGRLHRSFTGKEEVRIYDYVDLHIPVLERMYQKRLKAYRSVGYQVGIDEAGMQETSRIFDNDTYRSALLEDLKAAGGSIILASPFPRLNNLRELQPHLLEAFHGGTRITLCTRPLNDLKPEYRGHSKAFHDELINQGFYFQYLPDLQLNFILIDERIIWYGSLDPLTANEPEETLIRMEDPDLAADFLQAISESGTESESTQQDT